MHTRRLAALALDILSCDMKSWLPPGLQHESWRLVGQSFCSCRALAEMLSRLRCSLAYGPMALKMLRSGKPFLSEVVFDELHIAGWDQLRPDSVF